MSRHRADASLEGELIAHACGTMETAIGKKWVADLAAGLGRLSRFGFSFLGYWAVPPNENFLERTKRRAPTWKSNWGTKEDW